MTPRKTFKERVLRHHTLKAFLKFSRHALRGSYRVPRVLLKHPSERRYVAKWIATAGRHPLQVGQPWLPFKAINWMEEYLTGESTVFEWGSGGSTVFFAKRVKYIVSLEDSPAWYLQISNKLRHLPSDKVQCTLIEPQRIGATEALDTSDPEQYASESEPGYKFESYARFIDRFPDVYFDLVLVDGRARPSCILHAMPKVKPGAVLVLDDAHRPRYREAIRLLDGWKAIDLSGLRSDLWGTIATTIAFQKPSAPAR